MFRPRPAGGAASSPPAEPRGSTVPGENPVEGASTVGQDALSQTDKALSGATGAPETFWQKMMADKYVFGAQIETWC